MKSLILSFLINLGLLISAPVMAFSGLLIQVSYHMGNHGGTDTNYLVMGINYSGWSDIHKISIILISIFMVFHIIRHWKWYTSIIMKNRIAKNKQVITLSIIFIFVAVTGYIPWLIRLAGGEDTTRKLFIEIHDKLALLFVVFLILHIFKKLKWFVITLTKLKNQRYEPQSRA
jgi:hypothetical protein